MHYEELPASEGGTPPLRCAGASLSAAQGTIILDAVDKQLNKDPWNQATAKSYPQPEHIFLKASKPNYKNA
jgi:hypothetical protein